MNFKGKVNKYCPFKQNYMYLTDLVYNFFYRGGNFNLRGNKLLEKY